MPELVFEALSTAPQNGSQLFELFEAENRYLQMQGLQTAHGTARHSCESLMDVSEGHALMFLQRPLHSQHGQAAAEEFRNTESPPGVLVDAPASEDGSLKAAVEYIDNATQESQALRIRPGRGVAGTAPAWTSS